MERMVYGQMARIQSSKDRSVISINAIFLTFLLLFPLAVISIVNCADSSIKVAIDLSHGQGDEGLAELEEILDALGCAVIKITEEIDEDALRDVKILMIGEPFHHGYRDLTNAEIQAITSWFNKGGKMIWVSGACDYSKKGRLEVGYEKIEFANRILEAIGAKLRLEPLTLVKYSQKAEPLQVVADEINENEELRDLTKGIKKVLFYGSTIVCGYDRMFGVLPIYTYVPLESQSVSNVFWLIKSGPHSIIFTADNRSIPYAHKPYECPFGRLALTGVCICGEKPWEFEEKAMGSYVVMAIERFAGPKHDNKIVVSGSPPYGGEKPIITSVLKGPLENITLDGPALIRNTIMWGLKIEEGTPIEAVQSINQYLFLLLITLPIIVTLYAFTLIGIKPSYRKGRWE